MGQELKLRNPGGVIFVVFFRDMGSKKKGEIIENRKFGHRNGVRTQLQCCELF